MRSIKAPSDVPLASSSEASKLSFASAAAKLSICAAMFSLVINRFAFSGGRHLTPDAAIAVAVTCTTLMIFGFLLAMAAFWFNRRDKVRSVTILAFVGAVLSGLLMGANVYTLLRAA